MNELQIADREKEDLSYLVVEILEAFQVPPHAIFLCGGYGRNEGAWIENESGQPEPYNDYDFVVITDTPLSAVVYQKLRKRLARHVGIQWIDIDCYRPKDLKKMKVTIKNVDLVYASKLLYGDKNILNLIPRQQAERIGKFDIIKLYQTRIWTFLGSMEGEFRDFAPKEATFFKNQMAKATLAACDMLLVSQRKYTPLYTKRVKLICTYYSENIELCTQAKWALREKLRPSCENMKKAEVQTLYFTTKKIFCEAINSALGRHGVYFTNPVLTKRYFMFHTDYLLRNLYNRIKRQSNIIEKTLDVFLAQNYVLYANKYNVVDQEYMHAANLLLLKWNYINAPIDDWHVLSSLVADARNHI